MVAEIKLTDYRWAAVKGGRKAFRLYGGNTSLTYDDADGEAAIALSVCPRTFDAEKGNFGCYVKRAAFNAVRKLCLKHKREPTAEIPAECAGNAADFDEWLRDDGERAQALRALHDPEAALKLMRKTRRVWLSVPQIATKIKISERKARRLCEQARIPAVQVGREWFALSREVTAWRFAQIRSAYKTDGQRRIAERLGCSRWLVRLATVGLKPAKTISRRQKPLDVVFSEKRKHGKSTKVA